MPVLRSGDESNPGNSEGTGNPSGSGDAASPPRKKPEAKTPEPDGSVSADPDRSPSAPQAKSAEAGAGEQPGGRNSLRDQAGGRTGSGAGPQSSSTTAAGAPSQAQGRRPDPEPVELPRQWSLLGEINASIDQASSRTENRILRGLMALDERVAARQHSMEDAIGIVLQDHARTLEVLRNQVAESSDRTKERMGLLEERMYETLASFIAVLQQIRAELSVLSDSIKALETETSLTRRAEPTQ